VAPPLWRRARRRWPSSSETELVAAQDQSPPRSPQPSRHYLPSPKGSGAQRRGRELSNTPGHGRPIRCWGCTAWSPQLDPDHLPASSSFDARMLERCTSARQGTAAACREPHLACSGTSDIATCMTMPPTARERKTTRLGQGVHEVAGAVLADRPASSLPGDHASRPRDGCHRPTGLRHFLSCCGTPPTTDSHWTGVGSEIPALSSAGPRREDTRVI